MIFQGTNILRLPRVEEYKLTFTNLRVDSFDSCSIILSGQEQQHNISLRSGFVSVGTVDNKISTYNTGEQIDLNIDYLQNHAGTGNICVFDVDNISLAVKNITRESLDALIISGNADQNITSDIQIYGRNIVYSLATNDTFPIRGQWTGYFLTDAITWAHGNSFNFYNTLEQTLTGTSIYGCLDSGRENFVFGDNEVTDQENEVHFSFKLNLPEGEKTFDINTYRSGLYDSVSFSTLDSSNTEFIILNPFEGSWSGQNFIYSDDGRFLTLNYSLLSMDGRGNSSSSKRITGVFSGIYPQQWGTYKASYVTGFQLLSSGEYSKPPTALFTGYYYVTGLQQSLDSLLFNSGCTGDLGISFSGVNGSGNGATGNLKLQLVQFQNIYAEGNRSFYIVTGYLSSGFGSGYNMPPIAIVHTGEYGNNCFDVPLASGYNAALFRPFDTFGQVVPRADYLTGEVLYTTGLVNGGLDTGYTVTGLNITNIGSGYESGYFPLVSFVRDTEDIYSATGATGILLLKSSGSNTYFTEQVWSLSTGLMGYSLLKVPMTSNPTSFVIPLEAGENYFGIRIGLSGLDITEPMSASLTLSSSAQSYSTIISGLRSFSTDPLYLKKKFNVTTGYFNENQQLNFLVTQNELDTIYSTDAFVNNVWTIDIGDLDFGN